MRARDVAIAAIAMLHAWPALAYVRAVSESGVPLWWKRTCIGLEMVLASPPSMLSVDQYLAAGTEAANAWSHHALACTGVKLAVVKADAARLETGLDGHNVIVFRQDVWCEHPLPDDASQRYCYPPNALAVTTVFKNATTGEIVDADIELNAVSYAWADLVATPELANLTTADFQNTVTHELGHVLGLAHPCWLASDGPAPLLDNQGAPEPSCSDPNLSAEVSDSTMYPSVSTVDTLRRTLAADDQRAICDIYPESAALCPSSQTGGCAVATQPAPSARGNVAGLLYCVLVVAAGLGLGFRRARR